MELQAYRDDLEFLPEYPLTAEPLRIDCVVIKKAKDSVIKKNIAVIFREWGIRDWGLGIVVCKLIVLVIRQAPNFAPQSLVLHED